MHHLGYPSSNPILSFHGLSFSVQVFTFENLYEPDPTRLQEQTDGARYTMTCDGFRWAGGQRACEGSLRVEADARDGRVLFCIQARHPLDKIRCVKLTLHGLARGKIANLRMPSLQDSLTDIDPDGLILRYPNGFEGLYTPLAVMRQDDGSCSWFRSLDAQVRPKTFCFFHHGDRCDVELIFEECGRLFSHTICVPQWEIGFGGEYEQIMRRQSDWIADTYRLEPWESRADVPDWARRISLVATIHCEHWTGYAFNTYQGVIDNLRKIAREVDPGCTLVYLPGWEGRYYYQYGDLRPSPALGGEEGFAAMVEEAHRLGMHVMPMFMINGANPRTEDFAVWGAGSYYCNPSGYPQIWGSCDWDTSRHYDHNSGFPLNPGAPLWQDRLVGQVVSLLDRYHFDAVFMDLAAVYCNDRRYDTHEGAAQIARRIREKHPEVLMAGEGWYDALSAHYPLTQPSLSLDGDCRWSDRPYAPLFDRSNRCFAHLGQGDVSRGSTGVFEFGVNRVTQAVPLRRGILPTITIVDGTLEDAPDKAAAIFRQARRYAAEFLALRP